MELPSLDEILQIINIIVLLLTAGILYLHLKKMTQTLSFNKESRKIQTTIECNRRYDEICNSSKENPEDFFSRFWSLQKNQFEYFKRGFVDEDDFLYWMISRHIEMVNNESYGIENGSIRESFKSIGTKWYTGDSKDSHDFLTFFKVYVYNEAEDKDEHEYSQGDRVKNEKRTRIEKGMKSITEKKGDLRVLMKIGGRQLLYKKNN